MAREFHPSLRFGIFSAQSMPTDSSSGKKGESDRLRSSEANARRAVFGLHGQVGAYIDDNVVRKGTVLLRMPEVFHIRPEKARDVPLLRKIVDRDSPFYTLDRVSKSLCLD